MTESAYRPKPETEKIAESHPLKPFQKSCPYCGSVTLQARACPGDLRDGNFCEKTHTHIIQDCPGCKEAWYSAPLNVDAAGIKTTPCAAGLALKKKRESETVKLDLLKSNIEKTRSFRRNFMIVMILITTVIGAWWVKSHG